MPPDSLPSSGGRAVGLDVVREWPEIVQRHVAALRPKPEAKCFLDLLGRDADYYGDLETNGVPLDGFSYYLWNLNGLTLEPEQTKKLTLELLHYADELLAPSGLARLFFAKRLARRAEIVRDAGVWLWFWASLDCPVEADT